MLCYHRCYYYHHSTKMSQANDRSLMPGMGELCLESFQLEGRVDFLALGQWPSPMFGPQKQTSTTVSLELGSGANPFIREGLY